MQGDLTGNQAKRISFILVLVVTLFICVFIFSHLLRQNDPYTWDTAAHAVYGYEIYQALKVSDISAFILTSGKQIYWPFFQSWVLGIFFLVGGVSNVTAGLSSIVCFFLVSVLIFVISLKLSHQDGWLIGLTACFLWMTAPEVIRYASIPMTELLGTFVTLLSISLYLQAQEKDQSWLYVATSLAAAVVFFTKFNYGLMILGWMAADVIRNARVNLYLLLSRKNILLFIPALTLIIGYLSYPFPLRLKLFLGRSVLQGGERYATLVEDPLLFYPKVLMEEYSASPFVFWVLVLSLGVAIYRSVAVKHRQMIPLLLLVLLCSLVVVVHPVKESRLMMTFVPVVFVTASYGLLCVVKQIGQWINRPPVKPIVYLGCLGLAIPGVYTNVANGSLVNCNTVEYREVYFFITNRVDCSRHISLFGGFAEIDAPTIKWYLLSNRQCGDVKVIKNGFATTQSKEHFARWLENDVVSYIITLDIDTSSNYYDRKSAKVARPGGTYVQWMKEQHDYQLIDEKYFPTTKITAAVYYKEVNESNEIRWKDYRQSFGRVVHVDRLRFVDGWGNKVTIKLDLPDSVVTERKRICLNYSVENVDARFTQELLWINGQKVMIERYPSQTDHNRMDISQNLNAGENQIEFVYPGYHKVGWGYQVTYLAIEVR